MCNFMCGTRSHAKLSSDWSAIDYQVTFEWDSRCSMEVFTGCLIQSVKPNFEYPSELLVKRLNNNSVGVFLNSA